MYKVLVSSNGALSKTSGKVVYNLTDDIPSEYRKLTGIVFDGNVYYDTLTPLQATDTIRLAYKVSKACNVFGCYTDTSATNNYSLYLSTSTTGKYMRYGNGTYNSYVVTNKRYDVVITPTGTSGLETDSTWTAKTFTCSVNCLIGTTSASATSAKFTGTMYGEFVIDGKRRYVPAERVVDGEIGYYDLYSEEFITNQGSGTPTKLGYAT